MNLIVGGTGFIGGHLAEYFFAEGEISKGIFRKGSHLRIMDQCGIQCLEADLLDKESLHEPLEMVNVVYNLASPTPDHEGQEGDFLEVIGNLNPGDTVVRRATDEIRQGTPVETEAKTTKAPVSEV